MCLFCSSFRCEQQPENILCTDEEEDFHVVITDFGLSKLYGRGELMRTSCGTLQYAAPEVLDSKPYSEACDMWAFGVVVYVVLTGCFPFNGRFEQVTALIRAADYHRGNLEVRRISQPGLSFFSPPFIPHTQQPFGSHLSRHL